MKPKKTHKMNSYDARSLSCYYKLVIKNQNVSICKGCFVKSLGETNGFDDIVVSKRKESSS